MPAYTRRAPRQPGNGYSAERIRGLIKAANLVNLLQRFASGEQECQPHQVTAALGLLRKVLPDLQATLVSGDPQLPLVIVTRAE